MCLYLLVGHRNVIEFHFPSQVKIERDVQFAQCYEENILCTYFFKKGFTIGILYASLKRHDNFRQDNFYRFYWWLLYDCWYHMYLKKWYKYFLCIIVLICFLPSSQLLFLQSGFLLFQVVKMLAVVVLIFALCWLPLQMYNFFQMITSINE